MVGSLLFFHWACVSVTRGGARSGWQAKEYDLADKNGLADFLEHADIQLGGPGKRSISKDALHTIVRHLKGDRFTVDMLQGIVQEVVPDREGLLSCEDLARCLRRPDPAPEPEKSNRYDLAEKKGLADFLKDADIRLVPAYFILKLHQEGERLPRRQEAESAYVDGWTALVTHEEVQAWADGWAPDGTQIVSLSHCWESREHCDPYGYQVAKLAKALTGEEWVFIDYVSLYQFQRLSQQQNVSFRRAMQHMHVLYCHENSSSLRIESLTPEADIAKAETMQECLIMYHHPTGLVKPVPVTELVKNRTPDAQRGWCAAEREWSSTRTATNLSREVDAPEGEKGGSAPMVPEAFKKNVAHQLKFTHLDDVETVCRLQAEVYKEKAEMCRSLRLVDLGADALGIALSALERYPVLESVEIVHCELSPKLPLLLKVVEEIKLRQLHLQHNELLEEGIRQVIEAIKQNRTLKQLSLGGTKIAEEGAFALVEALRVSGVSGVEVQLDLNDSDLGKAAVAVAGAVRAGQVKQGIVIHPGVEFLCMLKDEKFHEVAERQMLELDFSFGWRLSSGSRGDGRPRNPELLERLPWAFPHLPALRDLRLDLRDGLLGADGLRALALGLRQQQELEELTLRLQNNSLGPDDVNDLASALAELKKLKALKLILSDNEIGAAGAAALADGLQRLPQLTKLVVDLSNNKLSPAGAQAWVQSMQNLHQLTALHVDLRCILLSTEEEKKLRTTFDGLVGEEKASVSAAAATFRFLESLRRAAAGKAEEGRGDEEKDSFVPRVRGV
ncbi:NLRC3, partial [Symbiodinium sp. CCMP2592]